MGAQPHSTPIPRDTLPGTPHPRRGSCHPAPEATPLPPAPRTRLRLSETPNPATAVPISEDKGAGGPLAKRVSAEDRVVLGAPNYLPARSTPLGHSATWSCSGCKENSRKWGHREGKPWSGGGCYGPQSTEFRGS